MKYNLVEVFAIGALFFVMGIGAGATWTDGMNKTISRLGEEILSLEEDLETARNQRLDARKTLRQHSEWVAKKLGTRMNAECRMTYREELWVDNDMPNTYGEKYEPTYTRTGDFLCELVGESSDEPEPTNCWVEGVDLR